MWRILIVFLILSSSPVLAEGKSVNPGSLSIELFISPSAPQTERNEINSNWAAACASLGSAFEIKGNYFFHGIAASHKCRLSSEEADGKIQAGGWILRIVHGQTTWTLNMFFGAAADPDATLVISGGAQVIKALADRQLAKHVAMKIMDDLPMARLIDEKSEKNSFSYENKSENETLAPIEEYKIFGMSYLPETRVWVSRVVGKATLVKDGKAGSWNWAVDLNEPLQSGEAYWAQDARGRGSNARHLSENLEKELKKHNIGATVGEKGKPLHVGFRYGYPISKNYPLISKSSMVGIVTEVHGGLLEGLRWYWDFAPEVKQKINGETMNFSWSRPSLGWSFGFNFDSFVNRVDVTPKIGLMGLNARVPFETDRGIVPVEFRFKSTMNLGIEIGMETASRWFLVRFWGATDASGFVDLGGPGTIKSLRGGIDTYWDLYQLSDQVELSLLVFGFGEKLSLTKNKGDVDASSNVKIEGISYELGIVGAGLIFAW